MSCLQFQEHISGNIFIRPVRGNRCTEVGGHTHNFDHTTFVISGVLYVKFEVEGKISHDGLYHAGEHFLVKANTKHYIRMLENDTYFVCIYSHRGPNGEVVQEYSGNPEEHPASNPAYH